MGDFLAIVKEKNCIEVVSRSINQVIKDDITNFHYFTSLKVVIITVDDPKEGSLNPESLIDSIEVVFEFEVLNLYSDYYCRV